MNIRKYIASTTRQALKDIRDELGEDAVILSNRKIGEGVEIIALAGEDMAWITDSSAPNESPAAKPQKIAAHSVPVAAESPVLNEIKSMYCMLQQQIVALAGSQEKKQQPHETAFMCKMLNAGFSVQLARRLMEKLPADNMNSESWIIQVLRRNLLAVSEEQDIVTQGGAYALIGPTGVGKTTTTAKLAARAVIRYGADKVALLTTDSYRIGAYDQLKIYGRILGVEVQAVKGAEDLRLAISSLRNKHLILIDTVGMGQRDERVVSQAEMFDATSVPRLLLLNASCSGETLEEVVRMYHSERVVGCIPTKLDEAASLGAVLDVVIRHRLTMHYMANGQCVPEDLHPVNIDYLLHRSLKTKEKKSPFTLGETDLSSGIATAESNTAARMSYAL